MHLIIAVPQTPLQTSEKGTWRRPAIAPLGGHPLLKFTQKSSPVQEQMSFSKWKPCNGPYLGQDAPFQGIPYATLRAFLRLKAPCRAADPRPSPVRDTSL